MLILIKDIVIEKIKQSERWKKKNIYSSFLLKKTFDILILPKKWELRIIKRKSSDKKEKLFKHLKK